MTNDNSTADNAAHTPPTNTDLTNNSSPISDPTGSGSGNGNSGSQAETTNAGSANPTNSDNTTADPMAQPQPPAQDAGRNNSGAPDLHTSPPSADLPLTSSTGTGFNTPDAGTGVPDNSSASANAGGTVASTPTDDTSLPGASNVDRDALAGQNKGASSQATAEAVSSTGPV